METINASFLFPDDTEPTSITKEYNFVQTYNEIPRIMYGLYELEISRVDAMDSFPRDGFVNTEINEITHQKVSLTSFAPNFTNTHTNKYNLIAFEYPNNYNFQSYKLYFKF